MLEGFGMFKLLRTIGHRTKLLLPLMALFLLLPARPAGALSCVATTPAENLTKSAAVVQGRLYKVETTDDQLLTIVAERVFKGDPPTPIQAHYALEKLPFQVGEVYIFFLDRDERGRWLISPCAPHHAGPPTAEEVALFGEGKAPAPPDTSRLWIPIVAASVAAGSVAFVLVRNRFAAKKE
jgi:hypothetical protein